MRLTLLGSVQIHWEASSPPRFRSQRTVALLGYLVAEQRALSRDHLAALFWPDEEPAKGKANLRRELHNLAQILPGCWQTSRVEVEFVPEEDVTVDIYQFLEFEKSKKWEAAAELIGGLFLEGITLPENLELETWLLGEQERWRQRSEMVLKRLIDQLGWQADYAQALEYARQRLQLSPWNEEAHRQLLKILARDGRRQEALIHYDSLCQLLQDELGVDPDADTISLVESIRTDDLGGITFVHPHYSTWIGHQSGKSRHNLPQQTTSFIGREKEIANISTLIQNNRLVMLTGVGGIGKTTLSIQVGHQLLDQFSEGVWLVELAPIRDPTLVPQTIAHALGLRESPNHSMFETLLHFLREKDCLLILDNCEHLIWAVANLVESLFQACPQLKILASSREFLNIHDEIPFYVPSLSLPQDHQVPPLDQWHEYEALDLFVDRATGVFPEFQVTQNNLASLVQICQRLDGIPLALELAATRVKMLTTEQIADRLNERFRLLKTGTRTALPRHQTLRALIDWSWELLSQSEQTLLQRLSIFAGGMTLAAIESICVDKAIEEHEVLDLLTRLVSKSLVIAERVQGKDTRYHLLETIRQYGQDRLSETDEGKKFYDNHLHYYLRLGEQAEKEIAGPAQILWLNRRKIEVNNFRVALTWACEADVETGLKLAAALWDFWLDGGYIRDGEDWLSRLLAQVNQVDVAIRAKAILVQSSLKHRMYKMEEAYPLAQESLALYQRIGDQVGIAHALTNLGQQAINKDSFDAHKLLLESLAIFRDLDNKLGIADVLVNLGFLCEGQAFNNYAQAAVYLEESKSLFQELGNLDGVAVASQYLGMLAVMKEDYEAAFPLLEEAIDIWEPMGRSRASFGLESLGRLYYGLGRYEQARDYFERALSINEQVGIIIDNYFVFARLGYVYLRLDECAQARTIFLQSLQDFKKVGGSFSNAFSLIGITYTLEGLASLATILEQPERAVKLYAWADETRRTFHDQRPPNEQTEVERDMAAIREMIDEEIYSAAYTEGKLMTKEEAITLALEDNKYHDLQVT